MCKSSPCLYMKTNMRAIQDASLHSHTPLGNVSVPSDGFGLRNYSYTPRPIPACVLNLQLEGEVIPPIYLKGQEPLDLRLRRCPTGSVSLIYV